MDYFNNKVVLITGAAGSIGSELVKELLTKNVKAIRALDIDETRLIDLKRNNNDDRLKILIGDIKDYDRIKRATKGVNIVLHLASLKHVITCEFDPEQALNTNVIGTLNVMKASISNNVDKVIYTSSDKAALSENTYGSTKALSEKIFNAASWGSGGANTIFSSIRFGNVINTRGGVIPIWKEQIEKGLPITITDPSMTRFMMTKKEAIRLILKATEESNDKWGGVFVLKMPIVLLDDLAELIAGKKYPRKIIGRCPGETDGELLMSSTEMKFAEVHDDYFFIPSMLRVSESKVRPSNNVSIMQVDSEKGLPVSIIELERMLMEDGIIEKKDSSNN